MEPGLSLQEKGARGNWNEVLGLCRLCRERYIGMNRQDLWLLSSD